MCLAGTGAARWVRFLRLVLHDECVVLVSASVAEESLWVLLVAFDDDAAVVEVVCSAAARAVGSGGDDLSDAEGACDAAVVEAVWADEVVGRWCEDSVHVGCGWCAHDESGDPCGCAVCIELCEGVGVYALCREALESVGVGVLRDGAPLSDVAECGVESGRCRGDGGESEECRSSCEGALVVCGAGRGDEQGERGR